jgi:hypothetical protein
MEHPKLRNSGTSEVKKKWNFGSSGKVECRKLRESSTSEVGRCWEGEGIKKPGQ